MAYLSTTWFKLSLSDRILIKQRYICSFLDLWFMLIFLCRCQQLNHAQKGITRCQNANLVLWTFLWFAVLRWGGRPWWLCCICIFPIYFCPDDSFDSPTCYPWAITVNSQSCFPTFYPGDWCKGQWWEAQQVWQVTQDGYIDRWWSSQFVFLSVYGTLFFHQRESDGSMVIWCV